MYSERILSTEVESLTDEEIDERLEELDDAARSVGLVGSHGRHSWFCQSMAAIADARDACLRLQAARRGITGSRLLAYLPD